MATLTLKIPEHLNQQLAATGGVVASVARSSCAKRSSGVCARFTTSGMTCLDLARDLVGSVSAPSSLSYDAKHMKGYGR